MKVVLPSVNTGKGKYKKGNLGKSAPVLLPPIPYEVKKEGTYTKGNYMSIRLRTNPAEEKSPTYDITVPYFTTGTCEELLHFLNKVQDVIKGQDLKDGPQKFAFMRQVLRGDAMSQWNIEATGKPEDNVVYDQCVKSLVSHVFPVRALVTQKRYMRHFVRKPLNENFRTYKNRLMDMNNELALFPPNFNITQKFDDDDLLDVLQYGIPNSWQKLLVRDDFDPYTGTLQDLVNLCEKFEFCESIGEQAKPPSTSTNSGPSGKASQNGSGDAYDLQSKSVRGRQYNNNKGAKKREHPSSSTKNRYDADKFCELHQVSGHDLANCTLMRDQAKKMRMTWETQKVGETSGDRFRKKKFEEKNLHTMISGMVANAMRQEKTKRKQPSDTSKQVHFTEQVQIAQLKKGDTSDENTDSSDNVCWRENFNALTLNKLSSSQVDSDSDDDDEAKHEIS